MDKTVLLIIMLSGLNTLTTCLYHQYHLVNMNKTWTEAQSYCRKTYTDLATISDLEESISLYNLLYYTNGYSGEAWIGLKLYRWRWSLDNNETEEISNGWPTGYPWYQNGYINNNWQKTCVVMTSSGMWNRYTCDSANHFVCYDGSQNATQTFVLIKEWMTWYQAQNYCRDHYTDLATVRNQTENQAILNLTMIVNSYTSNVGNQTGNQTLVNQIQTYYISLWIGLYRDGSWSDGSNSSYYYNRGNLEDPDFTGLNESCVTAQSTQYFYDNIMRNCNKTLPFVCFSGLCSSSPNISHQYHMVNMNKTWTEAQSYCRETYTDLATVSDPEEYNSLVCLINSTLGYSGQAWIGLKFSWRWSLGDTEAEGISNGWPEGFPWYPYGNWYQNADWSQNGQWYWNANSLSNWNPCVLSYDGQWQGYYCDSHQYFVCYDGSQNTTQNFVLGQERMTWYQAQNYCRDHYTDLAIVRNQTENQVIQNLTATVHSNPINVGNQTVNQIYYTFYPVWIGLYSNGSWSDGSQFHNYFINVQGLNRSCVTAQYVWDYRYYTNNCNDYLPFICYEETKNTTLVQTTEPATTQPLTTEPATTQPLATEPATTHPLTTEPATTQPLATEPATTEPLATKAPTPPANSGSNDYINKVVLQKLHEELIRRGLPEKFTLQLRATFEINP